MCTFLIGYIKLQSSDSLYFLKKDKLARNYSESGLLRKGTINKDVSPQQHSDKMNLGCISAAIFAAASLVSAKVYLNENFDNADWQSTWKVPSSNPNTLGHWEVSAGKFFADAKANRGLRTLNDMHFYALTAPLTETFSNENGDLVVQFSAKNEHSLDCGGAYIKVKRY